MIPENSTIVVKESQPKEFQQKKLKLPIVKPNLADNLSYESSQVWCETLDRSELLNHESLQKFDLWLKDFQSFIQQEHRDPENRNEIIKEGINLAKERAVVFEQIIQLDPESAIRMALNSTLISELPASITDNLEKSVSGFADVTSLHYCFSTKSPHEMISRSAKFHDGSSYKLFTYGKKKFLPSIRNMAFWGVALNDKLAAHEESFISSEEKNINGDTFYNLELGGDIYSFDNEPDRKIFADRVSQFENATLKTGSIRYPIIAGSSGETFFNAYWVIPSRLTWEEANATATAWGAKLVTIQNSSDQVIIGNLLKRFRDIGSMPSSVEDVWTGGEYNATSGAWEWIDDTNFSNFSNWGPSKPDKNQTGYAIASWMLQTTR